MIYCTYCGKQLLDESRFCVYFLRIDYIPPTVDCIHFLTKMITFRLATDYIQGFALIYYRLNDITKAVNFTAQTVE